MKNIKSIICIALAGLSLTSCKDFLTLMPLNEIVLENFWTDKSDVESVLLGAYNALEKSDCITRMSIWGEMRSDNIVANESNASNDIIQITKDNILETNSYTSWKCFYDVINRANTVLYFAPQVAAKTYSLAENTKITTAGAKTKYRLRLSPYMFQQTLGYVQLVNILPHRHLMSFGMVQQQLVLLSI